MLLAIDVMRVAHQRTASAIALLAGDGDYAPLMQVAKDEGLTTILCHAAGSSELTRHSDELWAACDERFAIDAGLVERIRR